MRPSAGSVARPFPISTAALKGDEHTYNLLEAELNCITNARDALAQPMITMLEGAAFDNQEIDEREANRLIIEAEALIDSVR